MEKVLQFSHKNDIDGIGCVILGKLAFDEINYVLASNIEELELVFRNYLKSNKLDYYNKIYITDLALYEPSLSMVAKTSIKDKIMVFDHHKRAIDDGMNKYSFTHIMEEEKSKKVCGTELFYQYLSENNFLIPTKTINQFVELTRLEDTWEWKKFGETGKQAHDLAILFQVVGKDNYISRILNKLQTNKEYFSFSKEEINLIQKKKREYNKQLKSIMSLAEYYFDENNNKYGIVFANYEYRNELPEYIEENNNPENIKYFIVVAMDQGKYGQKSYRVIDQDFDVNEIAKKHGGGGHPKAAAVSITKEQKEKVATLPKRTGLKYLAESIYTTEV